jgi:hypothetical protein
VEEHDDLPPRLSEVGHIEYQPVVGEVFHTCSIASAETGALTDVVGRGSRVDRRDVPARAPTAP